MAKNSNNVKKGKPAKRQSAPPRNPIYMGVIGILAAAWIVWRLEPSQGLGVALLIGVLVGLAWLIFVVAFDRSQRQGDDD